MAGSCNVIVVSSSGDGDYITIAGAIAAASSGDVIRVDTGVYTCDNLTLAAGIDLKGAGKELTRLQTLTEVTTLTAAGANIIQDVEIYNGHGSNSDLIALNMDGSAVRCFRVYAQCINSSSGTGDATAFYWNDSALELWSCTGIANVVSGGTAYGLYIAAGSGSIIYGQYESSTGYGIYQAGASSAIDLTIPTANGSTSDLTVAGGTAPTGWYLDSNDAIVGLSNSILRLEQRASAPATPPSGYRAIYATPSGTYSIDDQGATYNLEGGP